MKWQLLALLATAVKNAGQKGGCTLSFCNSRINFLRDLFVAARKILWLCLVYFDVGSRDFSLLLVVVVCWAAACYDVAKRRGKLLTIKGWTLN